MVFMGMGTGCWKKTQESPVSCPSNQSEFDCNTLQLIRTLSD
jgi:hypothetical protein